MNIKNVLIATDDRYTTVVGRFESGTEFLFLVLKRDNYSPGDRAVYSPANQSQRDIPHTVVLITEVHKAPKVDVNSADSPNFLTQKVETAKFDRLRTELNDQVGKIFRDKGASELLNIRNILLNGTYTGSS